MNTPEKFTEEWQVAALKADALAKIREAEKAIYEWAYSVDVGPDRKMAFEIYENIRSSLVLANPHKGFI